MTDELIEMEDIMAKMVLTIDVEDWHQEALRDESPIAAAGDILERLEKGEHTAEVARKTIIWREKGVGDGAALPPNKLLLLAGAQQRVSRLAARQRHEVEGKDGKMFAARSFVGAVDSDDGNEQSYVMYDDKQAVDRANEYLENMVPGHIWRRLLTVYENGGDVKAAARQLKRTIDEQVGKLV